MKRRLMIGAGCIVAALSLISCGGSIPSTHSGASSMAKPATPTRSIDSTSCYSGDNGTPTTVSATVTFYGWPDNSPPGAAIAHPVIHSVAGGDGSYCNPTTFATEPTSSENSLIPYGTRIYVPFIHKYFIREDDCTASGPSVGSGSNGCSGVWTDLWIGGDSSSNMTAVVNCENNLTPGSKQNIILHAPPGEYVNWYGPIWNDQLGCNAGGSPVPSPSPSPKPTATPSGGNAVATITWYDYFDNGDSCAIAHPVIHSCAGGTGTYSNPITFAAYTNNSAVPYGARIYLPSLQRYFIREDDCDSSNCPNNSTFILWIGGNSSDNSTDMGNCETYLTNNFTSNPNTPIIMNPPSNEPVSSLGQIWNENNGECNGSYNY
jgi:hypothetical protein